MHVPLLQRVPYLYVCYKLFRCSNELNALHMLQLLFSLAKTEIQVLAKKISHSSWISYKINLISYNINFGKRLVQFKLDAKTRF